MNPMTLFGALLIVLSICICGLLIKLPRGYWIKFVLVPLIISLGLLWAYELPAVLGHPVEGYPREEFTLVGFKVMFVGDKPFIEAWVRERGESRLYRFPLTQEVLDALTQMAHDGSGARGKFHGPAGGRPGARGGQSIALAVTPPPIVTPPPKISGGGAGG